MKIVQCITRMIVGGAQEVVLMTCGALTEAGHDVVLVHGPTTGPEGSLLQEAAAVGARLIEVPTLVRQAAPLTDWRCQRKLRRLFTDLRPDVVHTHSSKAGILGRGAAWSAGVGCVVHTIHGLGFHDRQHPLIRNLFIRSERWAAKRCHHLIAVSPQMTDAFEQHHIAARDRMTVIPSAVDLSRFDGPLADRAEAKAAAGLPRDAQVLGLLARLDALKGHLDVVAILPALARRFPKLHTVFIGDGYDRGRIEAAVASQHLQERVTFTGRVSREAVPALLDAVDVSVLPSYQEGQSITLLQSLLRGCGIVAYHAGGIPSVCIDGKTGRLVPVGDTGALADAIAWMFEHPDERATLAEQGRALARSRFSPRQMTDATLGVYDRVLRSRSDGAGHSPSTPAS